MAASNRVRRPSGWLPGVAVAVAVLFLVPGPGHWASASSGPSAPVRVSQGAVIVPAVGPGSNPVLASEEWTNVTGGQRFSPGPLRGASLVFDRIDNEVVEFGGCSATACPAPAATWQFSGGTWSNLTSLGPQPPARSDASMTFDSRDGYVLLFGGWAGPNHPLNDTWGFAGGTWTNLTNVTNAPPARWSAGLSYDRLDAYAVLFGGTNGTATFNDTWRFVQGVWRNLSATTAQAPAARSGAGFAWDDIDLYSVLFGGTNVTGVLLNDTWSFVHGQWAAVNVTSTANPSPRTEVVLSYYGQDNAIYLFGGTGGAGPLGDTWKYSGQHWVNVTGLILGAPPSRGNMGTMESSLDWTSTGAKVKLGYMIFYGGSSTACANPCGVGALGDTWVYELPPELTAAALPSVAEVGQPVVLSVTANAGTAPYSFTWQLGDGNVSSNPSPIHAYSATGTFVANVTATDFAGVTETSSTDVMVVVGPAVKITVRPATVDVAQTVSFVATPSGGTSPYSVRWGFGDTASTTGLSATHAYALAGRYTGNATVTDSVFGVGMTPFSVLVNPTLTFASTVPSVALVVNATGTFLVNASGGTPPYGIHWGFGDGTAANGSSVSHSFATAGNFTISLAVNDSAGEARFANYTVAVTPDSAPPKNVTRGPPAAGFNIVPWLPWIALVAAVAILVAFLFVRRRRARRAPDQLIAAAAAGQMPWGEDDPTEPRNDSRSARRAGRTGRR